MNLIIVQTLINMKNLLNIFIDKYKETLNYNFVCKNIEDNFLTTKTKYIIISFLNFLFIFFDFGYNNMVKFKDNIIKLSEKYFFLVLDISYKLILIHHENLSKINTNVFKIIYLMI